MITDLPCQDNVPPEPLRAENYADFSSKMASCDCRACGLWEGRKSIVVSRGNPKASLMLVGEAPGRSEDEQGKPFVGRAGKLLDRLMTEAGIDGDKDVIIVNVVKCRPPNNRPPKPHEAAACRPFLSKQLALVGPRLVGLLGRTALRHFSPSSARWAMSDVVGRSIRLPEYAGVEFFPLYHPAALIYNHNLMGEASRHWRRLRNLLAP